MPDGPGGEIGYFEGRYLARQAELSAAAEILTDEQYQAWHGGVMTDDEVLEIARSQPRQLIVHGTDLPEEGVTRTYINGRRVGPDSHLGDPDHDWTPDFSDDRSFDGLS